MLFFFFYSTPPLLPLFYLLTSSFISLFLSLSLSLSCFFLIHLLHPRFKDSTNQTIFIPFQLFIKGREKKRIIFTFLHRFLLFPVKTSPFLSLFTLFKTTSKRVCRFSLKERKREREREREREFRKRSSGRTNVAKII